MEPQPLTSQTRIGSAGMRPLVIDDEARLAAKTVRTWAEKQENWYKPPARKCPGDDHPHVLHINTYRVVYSITAAKETETGFEIPVRHISISVPGGKYANVPAVLLICELMGFTGWDGHTLDKFPDGWSGHVNQRDKCLVLIQRYEP